MATTATRTSARSVLQQVAHKLVGARSAPSSPSCTEHPAHPGSPAMAASSLHPPAPTFTSVSKFQMNSVSNLGQTVDIPDIARHRLVFLGEIHSQPSIVAFQRAVVEEMASSLESECQKSELHIVMEHFSFDMQDILNDYQQGAISFDELVDKYRAIGTENHDLEPYRALLEDCRNAAPHQHIHLHAGFLPRTYARMLMKEGETTALQACRQWLPSNLTKLQGTDLHYSMFESLLTGRSLRQSSSDGSNVAPPSDRFRGIFQAQLLKDEAMAHYVSQLIEKHKNDADTPKFLVICGNGHVLQYCGVPERVLQRHSDLSTCLVVSHEGYSIQNKDDRNNKSAVMEEIHNALGPSPADYVFVYQQGEDFSTTASAAAKEETKYAYDKVGESAHLPGNMEKAAAIMKSLGYTDEQFAVAGPDAYNFQGVGNPHIHADIKSGDCVLDVGSGLGVDSFIAKAAAGDTGRVIGIDISAKEVHHAQARADERGLDIRFEVADMEAIPFPDETFDEAISNGAFCLAPNKEKAFAEIFRVLKPGGRLSICTSTIKVDNLEPGVNWPLCMKLFISKKDIQPMCERLGYVDVFVDDSDSSMMLDLPEEVLDDSNPERSKIHVGSSEFKHLEDYDMDSICARVCVVARKPLLK